MKEYPSERLLIELQFNADQLKTLSNQCHDAEILGESTTVLEEQVGWLDIGQYELCQKYLTERMIEIHVHKLPVAEEFAKVIQILQQYGYPFPSASPNSVGYDDELPF